MIIQPTSSCDCAYSCSTTQNEEAEPCDALSAGNLTLNESLLSIVKEKQYYRYGSTDLVMRELSPLLHNPDFIPYYKKWKFMIDHEFGSIINVSLSLFANKLAELSCGSISEKKLFLSVISRIKLNVPFVKTRSITTSFISSKIEKAVRFYAGKEVGNVINTGSNNYGNLRTIILRKARSALLEENNISKLIKYISNMICEFHEKKQYKEYFDNKFSSHFDAKKTPFAEFTDLYCSHMEEDTDILSKSIDILHNIGQNEECCMSFAFSTFLGNTMFYHEAKVLNSILIHATDDLIISLKELLYSGKVEIFGENDKTTPYPCSTIFGERETGNKNPYSNELKKFFFDAQEYLKGIIEKFLLSNDVVIIDRDKIATCDKYFRDEIVRSSLRYLRLELHSCIKI